MKLASRLTILGHAWTVHYWPRKDFVSKFGDTDVGYAECEDKEIYLYCGVSLERIEMTLRHELFHAYVSELCLDVANLSGDQMEEACAELLSKYGARILKQAAQSIARYKRLRTRVQF